MPAKLDVTGLTVRLNGEDIPVFVDQLDLVVDGSNEVAFEITIVGANTDVVRQFLANAKSFECGIVAECSS